MNGDVDLIADAKEWLADQSRRLQTHSEVCHRWHIACLVSRLVAALERTPQTASTQAECTSQDEGTSG